MRLNWFQRLIARLFRITPALALEEEMRLVQERLNRRFPATPSTEWEPRREYAKPKTPQRSLDHAERERALRLMEEQCRALDLQRLDKAQRAEEIRKLAASAADQVRNRMGVRRLTRPYWAEPPLLTDPELREQLRRELDQYFTGDT